MAITPLALDIVKRSIAELNRDFETRFAAGDAESLVKGYFVDDAAESPMASPPGAVPPVRGQKALVALFKAQCREASAIRLETLEVAAGGEIAYEMGRAHLTLRTGPQVFGRYTVLWKHQHGTWRAQIDFFAADGWSD